MVQITRYLIQIIVELTNLLTDLVINFSKGIFLKFLPGFNHIFNNLKDIVVEFIKTLFIVFEFIENKLFYLRFLQLIYS